jgi:hypothetical protein
VHIDLIILANANANANANCKARQGKAMRLIALPTMITPTEKHSWR